MVSYMLKEFRQELRAPKRFRSNILTPQGLAEFDRQMERAIQTSDETSLCAAMEQDHLWEEKDAAGKRINVAQAAARLATNEFNTWYVRGLAKRLLDEDVATCEVYRAAPPKWAIAACSVHEGQQYPVLDVYNNHRASYWPVQDDSKNSIPFGPGCHHTIRRVSKTP